MSPEILLWTDTIETAVKLTLARNSLFEILEITDNENNKI